MGQFMCPLTNPLIQNIWPLELKAVPFSSSLEMTRKLLDNVTAA